MKRYEHVIVIGVDGMGNFNTKAKTPNIDKLFKDMAYTDYALSMNPTISAENWGAMILGAEPYIHKLTNQRVETYEYKNNDLPSVFNIIRQHYPDELLSSFCNWNPINSGIIENDLNVLRVTADNDEDLTEKIVDNIKNKPLFFFIQFDQCDGAGHKYGYGTKEHIAQIEKTDLYIGKIADEYKNQGIFEDTLFIVIADHGGYIKGHGGYTEGEKFVFFGVRGKNIKSGKIEYASTKDISALVLYALGIDIPEYNEYGYTSQVPLGIFENYSNDYNRVIPKTNYIKSRKTPLFDSREGMSNFIPREKLSLALFFDNDLNDITGKAVKEEGLVKYYSDGVYSSRGELGLTGYITAEEIKLGNESFSVCVWFKIDKALKSMAALCGTKDLSLDSSGGERGFLILQKLMDTTFIISNGKSQKSVTVPFREIEDGWVHLTAVFDKEKKEIRIYYNFKEAFVEKIEDEFLCSLDNLPFTIGNDAAHKLNNAICKVLVNIDDFVLFKDILTDEEIKRFSEYYN